MPIFEVAMEAVYMEYYYIEADTEEEATAKVQEGDLPDDANECISFNHFETTLNQETE